MGSYVLAFLEARHAQNSTAPVTTRRTAESQVTTRRTEESRGCSRRTPPLARLCRAAQQKMCNGINDEEEVLDEKKRFLAEVGAAAMKGKVVQFTYRRNDDVSGLLDITTKGMLWRNMKAKQRCQY